MKFTREEIIDKLESAGISLNPAFRTGPRLVQRPTSAQQRDSKLPGFEYAEHGFLGDAITLSLADGSTSLAEKVPFTLPNGLSITYGQINGLAGDFYGTSNPISDGKTQQDQNDRFLAAWQTLATDTTRQPAEAQALLKILASEVAAIDAAIQAGQDPSAAYAQLPDATAQFEQITFSRPSGEPGYLGLAAINWDHFGADARVAYNAGHLVALQQAAKGKTPDNLLRAYTMSAFADHFLEDSFAAGHARTPRRQLHSTAGDADLCAKFMHDEDNAIGLDVSNPQGDSWHMYGDKRLLDKEDTQNRTLCQKAVQLSADEVYAAWSNQKVLDPADFQVWQLAPTLESARSSTQALAPLFTFDAIPERRQDITKRRQYAFTSDYWYWSTLILIKQSGLWNYPITL